VNVKAAPVALADARLPLAGDHQIVLTRGGANDELCIWSNGADQPLLVISVGAAGVAVKVSAATVTIEATDLLKLEAKRVVLSALQELSLESAGNLRLQGSGEVVLEGSDLALVASRGDVRVRANDDVRLDGERVLMNCD
jgi:hypothetical protein